MKKTLLVSALAVVLVLAFATSAFALGAIPNRSSAFLGTIPGTVTSSTAAFPYAGGAAAYNQLRALSGGGTKAAYITWGQALDAMSATNTAAPTGSATAAQKASPHGNYTTTTVKCQVCHSVHKASINGTMLLAGTNGCIACHGSTTTLTTAKVSAGSSLDNRHGGLDSCTSYLCHTESPHGVDVTEYAAGASVLLSDWSDFLTGAALRSGVSNAKVTATKTNVNMDGYVFDRLDVDVFQPALDGTDVTAVNTAGSARGIAIQTGYTCANDGCHMNGSFNGLSSDAYLGAYKLTKGTQTSSLYAFDPATGEMKADGTYLGIYGSENLRTNSIKGHELYTAFGSGSSTTDPLTGVVTVTPKLAWAASGTCRACHDQTDPRMTGSSVGQNSFPHSNTSWRTWVSGDGNPTMINGVTGNLAETLQAYGFTARYNTAAWFNLADFTGGTVVETNVRNPIGSSTASTWAPRTVAMDGACLKCHRGSATSGVGFDY